MNRDAWNTLVRAIFLKKTRFKFCLMSLSGDTKTVAEPPELSRLKCADHHPKGNNGSNALQTEQFLVCRVTSR